MPLSRSQASSSPGARARDARAGGPAIVDATHVTPPEGGSQHDLRHYLHVLNRHAWAVVGMTLAVTLLALILSLAQSNVYRAKSQVLLNRQDLPAAVTGRTVDASASEDPARVAMTQAGLARSAAVAQRAVNAAGVGGVSAQDLLDSSSVTPNPTADILVFSVDNGNGADAAKLANAYAAAYSGYKLQLDTNSLQRARNELNGRLARLRAHHATGSALYRDIANSEQQLHTMQLLQSPDTVLTSQSSGSRVKPTPKRNALLGFGFGLLLGCGAAFLLEALDKRIRSDDEIERELELPLLARVPEPSRRSRQLAMLSLPGGSQADAIRRLATNVEFTNPDQATQTLMVTSAIQREGKSTTAANLAVALARTGKRVVVIDLDLRAPSLGSLFHIKVPVGLTNVIVGKSSIADALVEIAIPPLEVASNGGTQLNEGSLSVMPTGRLPVNPGEFVKANALRERVLDPLRRQFDHVIVDAPPMCIGADALALSRSVDALIVVTRVGVIDRAALRDLRRQLATTPTPVLGFVLTGVESTGAYGHGYYGDEETGPGLGARLRPVVADVAGRARRVPELARRVRK
jgi:succinoglycan biosynthesis transport protein ExoP